MTGSVSVFDIAEMNRRAEDALRKVRTELLRVGCDPDQIQILRQGYYLQLRFQHQIVLADPGEVLGVLEKIPAGVEPAEVWAKLVNNIRRVRRRSTRRLVWGVAVILIAVVLTGLGILQLLRT